MQTELSHHVEDMIGTVYALLPSWLDHNHPDREDVAQETLLILLTTDRDTSRIGNRRLVEWCVRDAIRAVIPDRDSVEPLRIDQDGFRIPVEEKPESDAERLQRRDRERMQRRLQILQTGTTPPELPDSVPPYRLHPLYRLVCLFCG